MCRPKLRVDTAKGPDSQSFAEALQARLARKSLPNVSSEGLILYALQIPNQIGKLSI